MTDEQITWAAKKYCELMGLNPVEKVRRKTEFGLQFQPLWEQVAERIKEHQAMQEAIKFAQGFSVNGQ